MSDGLFLDHTAPALTDEPNCETSTDSPFLQCKTQKGNSRLLYGGHSYTKKRSLKTSTDWRCTSRDCKGTLKTQINTDVVLKSSVHSCVGISEEEQQLQISEEKILEDNTSVTTRELASQLQHPYTRKLYQRRWRKTKSRSTSSSSVGTEDQ